MNVFAASHAIDDGADHDDEINEDAAHAHEALRGGVHGAGDEFSHTVLLEKSGRPFRRAAGITVYLLPSPAKSQGGFPERLACSDEIRSSCAMFPQEAQGPAGKGADRGLACRRASAKLAGVRYDRRRPSETCRAQPGAPRVLQAPKRKTPASFFREAAPQPCQAMRPAFCRRLPASRSPPMRRAFRRAKKSKSIRAPDSPPRRIMTGRRVGSSAAGLPLASALPAFRPDSGLLPFLPLPAMMPHHPTGDVHGIPKQRHAGT